LTLLHVTDNPEAEVNPPWWQRAIVGRSPRRTFVRVLILVVTTFLIFRFVLMAVRVDGESMTPTYKNNSIHLMNRLAYVSHGPQRGDVVFIRIADPSIQFPRYAYMKRIVGLPGETIAFHDGRALINGQPLDEPYVKFPCDWERPPVKLESDQYFVVGDNRSMPIGDHKMGEPRRSQILGKMLL